jgi:hypothetical protein
MIIVSWTLKKWTPKSHLKYNLQLFIDYCHNIQAYCFHTIRPSIFSPTHKYRRSDPIQNITSKRLTLSNVVVGEFPASSYSKSITMQAFIITETFTLTLPSLCIIGIASINKMKYACCVTKWLVYWLIKRYFIKLHTFHNIERKGDWKLWSGKNITYLNPYVNNFPTVTKKIHELRTSSSLGTDSKVTKKQQFYPLQCLV